MRDGVRITPNGVDLHVEVHGPDDAPAVALIHGWPDSIRCWDRVVPRLARTHRVIAYDQRGFGRSGMPEHAGAYRISEAVKDLAGILVWAGLERCTVVGHDFGGAVAWAAGGRLPQVAGLVVLASPHPNRMREVTGTDLRQLRNGFYAWLMQTDDGLDLLTREGGRLMAEFAFASDLPAEERAAYMAEWHDPPERIRRMANWYRSAYSPAVMNPDTPIKIPPCPVPVRYVQGDRDMAFVPELASGSGEWVDAEFDEVLVESASHWLPQTEPELVADLVADWVSRFG